MVRLPGIQVASVTPFDGQGDVDLGRLAEHTDWLIQNGVHGIVTPGSVGEYATLRMDERRQVVETVIDAAKGRVPVTAGVAAPSTAQAVGWAEHARGAGADAVMALPPINYDPAWHEVYAHFEAVSGAGLPIAVYNNPHDTAVDLTPARLAELSMIENVVAVKDFSGDVRRIPQIQERCDLEIIAGVDDLTLEGVFAGATGCIAGFANALPAATVEIYELARRGDYETAWARYRRVLPLFRYDALPILVQAIKHAMTLVGQPAGETRAPRLPLTESERQAIEQAFAYTGLTPVSA